MPHLIYGNKLPILFMFLIGLILHHHPALLHHHALILDRLLTFFVAFFALFSKLSFSQSLGPRRHVDILTSGHIYISMLHLPSCVIYIISCLCVLTVYIVSVYVLRWLILRSEIHMKRLKFWWDTTIQTLSSCVMYVLCTRSDSD